MEELQSSLAEYNNQLALVKQALATGQDTAERESLLTLQSDLNQLIQLTQESLDSLSSKESTGNSSTQLVIPKNDNTSELDDEYALFMKEMANSGAYEASNKKDEAECTKDNTYNENSDSDIEDELATLLGMKCAVYHTHKWGGQPSLHNAMVSAVVPRQNDDQFNDIQVRVLFTHPTHTEMLPCPFFLDGDCKFDDEQCRYSHGSIVQLSQLKEAIDPDFDSIKVGSRILLKLKQPDDEDISLTKKATEKYHLWHRGIVKSVDLMERSCIVKLEQGIKTGEKRKSCSDEFYCKFEEIFPLNNENEYSESDDSLSDTEYPEKKNIRSDVIEGRNLLIEQSLHNNSPAMGEWERHTRGIGSKLMLAMGYVPGTGLGSEGRGRVQPVEARIVPLGKSLDHCMALTEKAASQDPLKVEQKLKRLQKKEEERNKRAYEREKERERRNVFNFINKTLGDNPDDAEPSSSTSSSIDIKQSTSKDLNIEHFKITEDTKKIEREIVKLNSSLSRQAQGTSGHKSISLQIYEKTRELNSLRNKEKQITKEQIHRKDKKKMTVF